MGNVFHIQRFSLYDGPGVRTVVFLKGCPLRCVWCHNPEGLSTKSQIQFNPSKCIGCLDCVSACPNGCHTQKDGLHIYNRERCTACGQCTAQCCSNALSVSGSSMTPEEVMAQVLRDQEVYTTSGGGLTLSGGEPFAQADFTISLLQLAKNHGLHTCVETSGYADPQRLTQAAKCTDLFLYDYKVTDDALHQKLCGVSNKKILDNLSLLNDLGANIILRCPIIPGCNDNPEHIEGIAALAAKYDCVRQIHLEPYHRLGIDKAAQLGLKRPFDTQPPSKEAMEQLRQKIEALCHKPTQIS